MTRYSASRGIRYTAPPGPDGSRTDAETEAKTATETDTAEDADDNDDEAAADVGIEAADINGAPETPADD